MKNLETILNQEPIYLNSFHEKENVLLEFNGATYEDKNKQLKIIKKNKDVNILFASYDYENYSGDAWVLFEKGGKLYEVHGSHCSCYGLENQWDEEEVVLKEIENRLIKGDFGEDNYSGNEFRVELMEFLGIEID